MDLEIKAQRTSEPASPPTSENLEGERNISHSSDAIATDFTNVPPLGVLPVDTEGPPLLVTDSWRRVNKSVTTPEIPTPPSQQSSSDSVFTDPDEITMVAENEIRIEKSLICPTKDIKDNNNQPSEEFKSPFSVSRHKRVELTPVSHKIGEPNFHLLQFFNFNLIFVVFFNL